MNRLLRVLAISGLLLGVGTGGPVGCQRPCKEAHSKWQKCMAHYGGTEAAKKLEQEKDSFFRACKKNPDKYKACLKERDCEKFSACLDKIGK